MSPFLQDVSLLDPIFRHHQTNHEKHLVMFGFGFILGTNQFGHSSYSLATIFTAVSLLSGNSQLADLNFALF